MKIAILGAGGMARTHAHAYAHMRGVQVAGFYGRHRARVAATAKEFHAEATTDAARLLRNDKVDAVDVVVPSGVHRQFVVQALENGKDVFCETPLALTLEDADAMLRAARRAGRLLLSALLMRSSAEYAYAREVALSRRLGRPTVVIASRLSRPYWSAREPRPFSIYGEPVVELMIFDFDYLNWVFGRPLEVSARGIRGARHAADYVLATVRYPGGIGLAEGSARMPESFPFNTRLRLLLERGLLESDFRILPHGFSSLFVEFSKEGQGRRIPIGGRDPYRAECAHFVACIRGEAEPSLLDARHDRDALRVALAAKVSMASGRAVPLRG